MPAATIRPAPPVVLVWGEDDLAVQQRARQLYAQWCAELGGLDHEIIDATVANSNEALRVLARLREALQTLPFFGTAKVVWLRDCNFLGDERAATSEAVTERLAQIAGELKKLPWNSLRLLVSAAKVDKRRVFYKTLEQLGAVESFAGWSGDDPDWAERARALALGELRARRKSVTDAALDELVLRVGPNPRQLCNEIEKLALYVGERSEITPADVEAVCVRNKVARAFALGDALGDRDVPRLLRCLDEELWAMQFDRAKSEIGLLYGLISKVRTLLFLQELLRAGLVQPTRDYRQFKAQWERLPAASFAEDRQWNPLAVNAYVYFKALPQVRNYTREELVRALARLLECNRQLLSSRLDARMILQQTLLAIAAAPREAPAPRRRSTPPLDAVAAGNYAG